MCDSNLFIEICKNAYLGKKIGNGRQKWEKACVNLDFPLQKWNTLMKIK